MFELINNIFSWVPIIWLLTLVIKFVLYSLALYIAMLILKIPFKKLFFKKYIWSVFFFGLLSNTIALMLANFIVVNFVLTNILIIILAPAIMFTFGSWLLFKNEIPRKRFVLSTIFAIASLIFLLVF